MNPQTTIDGLFGQKIQFVVPSYQRAYSWESAKNGVNDQVGQFMADILDQNPQRKYFLGHFLFSSVKSDSACFEVVDGQQRLTTIVIFMSALVAECKRQKIERLGDVEVGEIVETYIYHRKQKFVTVTEDRVYFDDRVVQMNGSAPRRTDRRSEQCIARAAEFFHAQMLGRSPEELERWFKIVSSARITTFVIDGEDAKETATQIFAFQNDRGKDLTNLEKVKAFLMNRIYRYAQDPERYIETVEANFSSVYSQSELLTSHEDTVLNWHCAAFLPASADTALESIKMAVRSAKDQGRWISNFSAQLARSFTFVLEVERSEEKYSGTIADICYLGKSETMPLIIKLMHLGKVKDGKDDDCVLRDIERILFKLTFTNGSYRRNDFVKYARELTAENYQDVFLPRLRQAVKSGFMWYWDFNGDCLKYFTETRWHYTSEIKYVLYKYENWLRQNSKHPLPPLSVDECRSIFRDKKSLENTIDHITPQDPGFTTYDDSFKRDYVSNIGNLSLLTWSGNSSKNDRNPVDEDVREKYNQVYLAQKEVYGVLCKGKWGMEEIDSRRNKIVSFIKEQWGIEGP